jgi:hypothetical protein
MNFFIDAISLSLFFNPEKDRVPAAVRLVNNINKAMVSDTEQL